MSIISLPPLGNITLESKSPLYQGRLFEIWAGALGEQPICCKTPRAAAEPVAFSGNFSGVETSIWAGDTSVLEDPAELQNAQDMLLMLEAEQIRASRGAWNHAVLTMSVWDLLWYLQPQGAHLPESALRRPVLVMPRHPGVPLSSLPTEKQRELFPALLPALWAALRAARHGDVTGSNILVDLEEGRSTLIDPGVTWWSLRPYVPRFRDRSWQHGHSDRYLFTTTASAYPLLPPQYGRPLREEWTLPDYLEQLLRSQIHFMPGVILGSAWFAQEQDAVLPSPADILALGVLYFEILTGRHPLPWLAERPAWVGGFGETSDGTFVNAMRRFQVQGVPNPSAFARISPEEEDLCLALLNLSLPEGERSLLDLCTRTLQALP